VIAQLTTLRDRLTVTIEFLASLVEAGVLGAPERAEEAQPDTGIGPNGSASSGELPSAPERHPGRAPTPCAECGELFVPASGAQRFCGAECRRRHHASQRAERRTASNGQAEPSKCGWCGAETDRPSGYCSTSCRRSAETASHVSEGPPA
jgi:hypothetical protein